MGFSTPKQEVLESSPQYQKIHQNILIIPPNAGHGFAALLWTNSGLTLWTNSAATTSRNLRLVVATLLVHNEINFNETL